LSCLALSCLVLPCLALSVPIFHTCAWLTSRIPHHCYCLQEAEDELQLQEAAELEEDRLRSLQHLEKQYIEWTTDPGLGKDGGLNEHGGALRVYEGRVFQLVQEQPAPPKTRPQALRAGLFALADTTTRFSPKLPSVKESA
jgi:hypothetical protein